MADIKKIGKRLSGYLAGDGLKGILLFGIFLRIIVFIFQGPANNDDHLGYIRYIYQYHLLPVSGQLHQSNHPPLYYFLASPLFAGGAKFVQSLSLIFSIATLSVIYLLIKKLEFIQPLKIKQICLLFACTLPQFILFANYISNDSLSFLIGALIFFQIYRLINKPTLANRIILAVFLGLGLSTKGTFLLFIPALLLLVFAVNFRSKLNLKKNLASLLIFIFIFTGLGAWKGVNNLIHFHRPLVIIDKDLDWIKYQGNSYTGWKSLYDVNIFKLAQYPVLSEHTKYSCPLMVFGSFWYQYIPESDFNSNLTNARYLGSAIYLLALLPTLLFLTGFIKLVPSLKSLFTLPSVQVYPERAIYEAAALLILLLNSLMIVFLAYRYNVYAAFQGRFLFPSLFAFIILLNSGIGYWLKKYPRSQGIIYPLLLCLYLLFVFYFCIEIFRKII